MRGLADERELFTTSAVLLPAVTQKMGCGTVGRLVCPAGSQWDEMIQGGCEWMWDYSTLLDLLVA